MSGAPTRAKGRLGATPRPSHRRAQGAWGPEVLQEASTGAPTPGASVPQPSAGLGWACPGEAAEPTTTRLALARHHLGTPSGPHSPPPRRPASSYYPHPHFAPWARCPAAGTPAQGPPEAPDGSPEGEALAPCPGPRPGEVGSREVDLGARGRRSQFPTPPSAPGGGSLRRRRHPRPPLPAYGEGGWGSGLGPVGAGARPAKAHPSGPRPLRGKWRGQSHRRR